MERESGGWRQRARANTHNISPVFNDTGLLGTVQKMAGGVGFNIVSLKYSRATFINSFLCRKILDVIIGLAVMKTAAKSGSSFLKLTVV